MIGYYIWFGILSFILGSIMCSGMTCLGDRLSSSQSWMHGRSHCDACGHELGTKDLIPVFSYLAHHGRCAYCGAKLSKKYVWTELLTGILFLLVFLRQGMISIEVIRQWGFISILLALSVADMDAYIIPDRLILVLIIWWFVFVCIHTFAGNAFLPQIIRGLTGGFVIAAGVLIIVLIMDRVLKKESMGGGDIKLLFAAGLYLGLAGSLLMLITACLIGLLFVVLLRSERIPFGPSISLGAVLVLLYGQGIIQWYLGLLG